LHPDGKLIDVDVVTRIIESNGRRLLLRVYTDVSLRKKQERIIQQQLSDLESKN